MGENVDVVSLSVAKKEPDQIFNLELSQGDIKWALSATCLDKWFLSVIGMLYRYFIDVVPYSIIITK